MSARIVWTALICAALYVCYFSHLGSIGFVGPDEPRYAWIARAMVETGDWVTPRLYGRPWFEKPVLYYWEAAACFKLFGISETTARLPSALSALLGTLAMAWLAWCVYGAETARWFLLLLPTSAGMIGFSHAAAMDMPFSGTLAAVLVCAALVLQLVPTRGDFAGATAGTACLLAQAGAPARISETRAHTGERSPATWLVLFGFFLGLAALAKGPAAIVLMGGAVFFWALFSKRWRDALRLLHPAAIVAFCATALPWYILCARRNPDFIRVFIIEHNFKRYLTPEFQHIQPFWYYGAVLLVAFLPWTVIFVWAAVSGAIRYWRTRSVNAVTLLLLSWSAFCVLFFSISKSKLPGYILLAIPTFMLLVCAKFATDKSLDRFSGLASGMTLMVIAAVGWVQSRLPHAPWPMATLILGGFVTATLTVRRQSTKPIVAAAITVATALLLLLHGRAAQNFDEALSLRAAVRNSVGSSPNHSSLTIKEYGLTRSQQYALSFYLHRELGAWNPKERESSLVFAPTREESQLAALGLVCYRSQGTLVFCVDRGSAGGMADSGKAK